MLCVPCQAADDECKHLRDTPPPHTIGYHVRGGFDGRDLWVVLRPDGRVCHVINRKTHVTKMSESKIGELKKAFEDSGFFGWNAADSTPVAADGLVRTIFYDDGQKMRQVTWSDPNKAPPGFDALLKQIDTLSR